MVVDSCMPCLARVGTYSSRNNWNFLPINGVRSHTRFFRRCAVQSRILGVLLLAVMVSLMAVPRSVQADEWHKTYNVSGKATLHIDTNDGAVRVSTWEGKTIEARVETTGWRIDESEVRIIERQTGNRLDFEARVPTFHWNGW